MPLQEKKMEDGKRADVLIIAEQADDMIGDTLASLIPRPEKPYKASTVSALAEAIRKVVALMDRELDARPYTAPVDELDPDLVRYLAATLEAAEDYGQPSPISPDAIRGDNELIVITEHLMKLSRDRDFRDFLDEELEEDFAFSDEAASLEEEEDIDEMLKRRMY